MIFSAKGLKHSIHVTLWLPCLFVFQWEQMFFCPLTFNKKHSILWISLSKINYIPGTWIRKMTHLRETLNKFQESFFFAVFVSGVSLFLKMKTSIIDTSFFSCTDWTICRHIWRDIMASSLAHMLLSSILFILSGCLIYLNVTVPLVACNEFASSFFESHQGGGKY